MLVATVSVALMAAALEAEGLKAQPFLAYKLGIYTDELHSKATEKVNALTCNGSPIGT